MDILEQLGITKEEMLARITDRALGITADRKQTGEESWEDIPFSAVVDAQVKKQIGDFVAQMASSISDRIDAILQRETEKVITGSFQRVDRWGAAVGEPTTIRDLMADTAMAYWTARVDQYGKQDGSCYGEKQTRAEFHAKKVMEEVYTQELQSEVKTLAADLKARIPKTISEEITKTVTAYLR